MQFISHARDYCTLHVEQDHMVVDGLICYFNLVELDPSSI